MPSSKHWNIWLAVALLAQWGLGVACDAGPKPGPARQRNDVWQADAATPLKAAPRECVLEVIGWVELS